MGDFWLYFNDGLNHFLNWDDYSHALTLLVLMAGIAAIQRKTLLWAFLLFNLGIIVALLTSTYDVISVKPAWIAFLVPLLILGMAFYDMFTAGKSAKNHKNGMMYFIAVFFGLVQGLSVSNHETTAEWAFPNLLGYFIGFLIAQILFLIVYFLLGFVFRNLFRFSNRDWALVVSAIIIGLIIPILAKSWL
jgi:hypothetical protein